MSNPSIHKKTILSGKERILQDIKRGVMKTDERIIRNALRKNAKAIDKNDNYALILASGCPQKAIVYKAIAHKVGANHLVSLQCGGLHQPPLAKHQSLLEYILLNDCNSFIATFSEGCPIASLSYNRKAVGIDLHPIRFCVSDLQNENKWDTKKICLQIIDLENCLNIKDVQAWYDDQVQNSDNPF